MTADLHGPVLGVLRPESAIDVAQKHGDIIGGKVEETHDVTSESGIMASFWDGMKMFSLELFSRFRKIAANVSEESTAANSGAISSVETAFPAKRRLPESLPIQNRIGRPQRKLNQ